MILNTYTSTLITTEIDTPLANDHDITYLNNPFDPKSTLLTTYTTTGVYNMTSSIDFTNISFYHTSQVDGLLISKQYTLIAKALDLSLPHNGTYLQSILPGNNIIMAYALDNNGADVRNIGISVELSYYYTSAYINQWYYNRDTIDALENDFNVTFTNYCTNIHINTNYYDKAVIGSLHNSIYNAFASYYTNIYKYSNDYDKTVIDSMLTIDAYTKAETDNLLQTKLSTTGD